MIAGLGSAAPHWPWSPFLEVYKTVIGAMQSVAWMLLIFFLFALVAYVVVRGFELRRPAEQREK